MKKVIIFLLIAIFFSIPSFAQDTTGRSKKETHMMKDCIKMKEGKMIVIKNGEHTPMQKDITLTNGTVVSTDGTVIMSGGNKTMLHDGQAIDMNGKIVDMKDKEKKMR